MDAILLRLGLVLLLVLVSGMVGRIVTARRARLRPVDGSAGGTSSSPAGAATTPTPDTSGPSAVLFGSPTCAPCTTLKRLLREVEQTRTDFTWRAVDAADHLDEARAHGVRTVPTLLVFDGEGTVVARTSGVPRRAELDATVARAAGPRDETGARSA